ncbi:hypothetical protein LTR94_025372 [Friedmanniomyces endolithicus]|nr:hypothetical protein LTR94_025372 [Friedmanniomyces endolithicus]
MAAGLTWIGPDPKSIRAMGLKDAAKALMIQAGVPVTPGYQGSEQGDEHLASQAAEIGYPVLIKAVAGGGGKGMKRVDAPDDFADGLASARREAAAAFGDDRVLIERYITRPRHIEVQVFGDSHGQVVHLFERDCSLQRRHQKVIEEAPAPGMSSEVRAAVTAAAVQAAKAVDYRGAGTIEFIADASEGLRADRIWFMEMNTRLQVEHPVTECITGVDLVEWQFRIAAGEPLPLAQADIQMTGWAMEARLYAEDPSNGFLPSIGRLDHFSLPEDIRVDTGFEEGGRISQHYDPMIAKLIVHEPTRADCVASLSEAACGVEIWPVKSNAGFIHRCLSHPRFLAGDVDTGFIASESSALELRITEAAQEAALALSAEASLEQSQTNAEPYSPWGGAPGLTYGLRLNASERTSVWTRLEGRPIDAALEPFGGGWRTSQGGLVQIGREHGDLSQGAASDGGLRAPMPGRIVATPALVGQAVVKGQPIVVLEAMKMEHALTAPFDGVVETVASIGDQVAEAAILAQIRSAD